MSRRDLRRSPRLDPEVDGEDEDGDDDEETEIPTSIEDLTSEADPTAFDRTFLAADAKLSIEGRFDPVAGRRQVIPRVAYVLNYNLVYNEDAGRWEPKKKGEDVFSEGWEDGSTDGWQKISGAGGDTLQVDNSIVFEGSFSGRVENGGRSGGTPLFRAKGEPSAKPGDIISTYFRWDNGSEGRSYFEWAGDPTVGDYRTRLDSANDQIEIINNVSGEPGNQTFAVPISNYNREWLYVEQDWRTDGTVTVTIEQRNGTQIFQETVTGFETPHETIGIHSQGDGDSRTFTWFDEIKIRGG